MDKKYLIVVAVFLSSIVFIVFLPNFNVEDLIIEGNKFVTNEEITKIVEFKKGQNIFLFNLIKARGKLLSQPFIKKAKVRYVFPNKIFISVSERNPSCYIKYLNDSYVLIDNDGIVLEVSSSRNRQFPIVSGINFSSFVLGQPLKVDNVDTLKCAFRLSYLAVKNDIEKMNLTIDFSSANDVHLYVRNADVFFGDMQDAEYKMALLKSILDSESEYLDKPCTLSINDKNQSPVLKFIS